MKVKKKVNIDDLDNDNIVVNFGLEVDFDFFRRVFDIILLVLFFFDDVKDRFF